MAINLKSYLFEGLYRDPGLLQPASGVYAILGRNLADPQWEVLDLGEADNLREHIGSHARREAWSRQAKRDLACAVLYCDELDRVVIEHELRLHFNPPCGPQIAGSEVDVSFDDECSP
jgi:hypothetical protein